MDTCICIWFWSCSQLSNSHSYSGSYWLRNLSPPKPEKVRIEAKQASIGRIEDLKSEIGHADRRIKELEGYQEDGDQESYQNLALEILPQLTYIKNAANDLRGEIPTSVYQRIQTKIRTVTDEIDEQLKKIEREKKRKEAQPKKTSLEELAPELVATVRNIQIDHEAILQKSLNPKAIIRKSWLPFISLRWSTTKIF